MEKVNYGADDVRFVEEAIKVSLALTPPHQGGEVLGLLVQSANLDEFRFMLMGNRFPNASVQGIKNFAEGLLTVLQED